MIIAGAGGHAIELLGILDENNFGGQLYFFDDTRQLPAAHLFNYPILTTIEEAAAIFLMDTAFVIGVGKPAARKLLAEKMLQAGGTLHSIISPHAHIGKNGVVLGEGLNIMTGAVITGRSAIGTGTLVHVHCSVHHNTVIGEYCELSPGCRILGGAQVGAFVSVGAGAIILPGIKVGNHTTIGAGAIVTKDVPENSVVKGVPGRW
jgi:sugar O-acyltransferase (sialic acid O-acetyltransferase NeuD family)